jgi:hypothetical protein
MAVGALTAPNVGPGSHLFSVKAQLAASLTPAAQRAFLETAKVIDSRPIGRGITGSLRLTLSDGVVTHDAAFQSVDQTSTDEDRRQGRRRAGELNFVDSYRYNIAAYEIARLVGLDAMMPVTVERRWNGRVGSLAWWVDDVLMDEAEREKSPEQPPSPLEFSRQRQRMFVFAELVRDMDRNKGNVLYTKDWRVIMIDFTRAFRLDHAIRTPEVLQQCDRTLYARLQTLTADDVRQPVGRHLTAAEQRALMARRALIVERVAALIRERGENAVLY